VCCVAYTWSDQPKTSTVHLVSSQHNEVPLPFLFHTVTAQYFPLPKAIRNYVIYVKIPCKNQDALGSRASPDCVSAVPCQDLFPERASGGRRVCWLRLPGWLVPGGIQIQDTVIAARRAQPSITYLIRRADKYVL
jgi:hypothetical protein